MTTKPPTDVSNDPWNDDMLQADESHDQRRAKNTLAIFDKCETEGCWHIYCDHCLHGGCIEFTEEQKIEYTVKFKDKGPLGPREENDDETKQPVP